MATHSSILALKIPWTEEPGMLQSMGLKTTTRPETKSPMVVLKCSSNDLEGCAAESRNQASLDFKSWIYRLTGTFCHQLLETMNDQG